MKWLKSTLIHVLQHIGERYKIKLLPDMLYLKLLYKHKTNSELNLMVPKSFTEKIQWLKLNDKNHLYSVMADKYAVKKYATQILGYDISIPTIGIYKKFQDIPFEKLPDTFVIKCTHDWNSVIICNDKRHFNIKIARKKISRALKRNHYYHSLEWAYKNINPLIIIEPFLSNDGITPPIDYRVYCFNGEPYFIHLTLNKLKKREVLFYDTNWNKLSIVREGLTPSSQNIEKPILLRKMLLSAKMISKNIPFLRVDFYCVNNHLYLGECTFYPGEGFKPFSPEELDLQIGELISIIR